MKLKFYTVTWIIQVHATTERKAAECALRYQRNPESTATCFEVVEFESTDKPVLIDLNDRNSPT